MSVFDGHEPRVDPIKPEVFPPTLETATAIRAEIELLRGERTRWRDFVIRGVVTPETFFVIVKSLVMQIAALEHALVLTGPELPRIA